MITKDGSPVNFQSKCINSLTGLRFVFVMMIVISHFEFLAASSDSYMLHFHNAGIGVAFFFMMSGFGLTYSSVTKNKCAMDKKWTPVSGYSYAFKKMQKLYVAYLFSMALMIPWTILRSLQAYDLPFAMGSCIGKFALGTTLLQSMAGTTKCSHILNGACWFLSTLFILYALYPLIEKINRKFLLNKVKLDILVLLAVFAIRIALFGGLYALDSAGMFFNDLSYGSPCLRITDFTIGILLCDIFIAKQTRNDSMIVGTASVKATIFEALIIIALISWWVMENAFSLGDFLDCHFKTLLDIVVAAVTIYAFSWQNGAVSKFLDSRIMLALGNSAMFIYLFHYPIRMNIGKITKMNCESPAIAATINIAVILVLTAMLTVFFMKLKSHKRLNNAK